MWRATYDGDGSRRRRLDGKGTIHYVGPYERSAGNGQDVTEVAVNVPEGKFTPLPRGEQWIDT